MTGKFSERNQTSTDLEGGKGRETEKNVKGVGRVDVIARKRSLFLLCNASSPECG